MRKICSGLTLVATLLLASVSQGALIVLDDIGSGGTGARLTGPHSEKTLGGINGIFDIIEWDAGMVDPVGTQIPAGYFTNDGSGGMVATFIVAIAGNRPTNTLGIFNSQGDMIPIFHGTDTAPTQAMVSFLDNGTVSVMGFGDGVQTGSTTGFGGSFGFYISGKGGTYFTDDAMNPGGAPQFLVYQGDGERVKLPGFRRGPFGDHEFIFAAEDLAYGKSDKDFNDFVFMVESITPVPEPATMILTGAGLLVMGALRRRRAAV